METLFMAERFETYVEAGKSQNYLQKKHGHKTTYVLTYILQYYMSDKHYSIIRI